MGSVSLSFARRRLRLAATLVLLAAVFLPALPLATPRSVLATHTTIKLPFLGDGAWYAWEGYNFSPVNDGTHWDCDPNTGTDVPSHTIPCRPLYIYKDSFDLRRVDEQTAWQPVLAPADGTICWIDSGFGGAAIDFGDGYVFAYFHTRIAGGLAVGQRVTRGQFLGAVAPEREAGNGGIAPPPYQPLALLGVRWGRPRQRALHRRPQAGRARFPRAQRFGSEPARQQTDDLDQRGHRLDPPDRTGPFQPGQRRDPQHRHAAALLGGASPPARSSIVS